MAPSRRLLVLVAGVVAGAVLSGTATATAFPTLGIPAAYDIAVGTAAIAPVLAYATATGDEVDTERYRERGRESMALDLLLVTATTAAAAAALVLVAVAADAPPVVRDWTATIGGLLVGLGVFVRRNRRLLSVPTPG